MIYGEFKNEVERIYKEKFPNSGINISLGALGGNNCFIRLYLAGSQDEFINGIAENDILQVGFVIYQSKDVYGDNPKLTDDLELPDTLIMEVYLNSITIIPDNPYMAYGRVRLPYRKTKGSPEKILQVFSKDVDILKQTLENLYKEGKIHDNHKDIVEKKLGISNVNESIEFRSKTKKLFESFQRNLNEGIEEDNFIKQCEESGQFYNLQMGQIREGFENGLSMEQVQVYAKPEFDDTQMIQIREGFENGLSMEQVQVYAKQNFDWLQMGQIREGFEEGLSMEQVQVYLRFNSGRMYEIREGFKNGLSMEQVQVYAKKNFNYEQMDKIREGFEEGLSMEQVQVYAKSKFNVYQMYEIKKGFENGLSIEEVQEFAKPEFDDDQMEEIRRKIEIENAAIERYKNNLNK